MNIPDLTFEFISESAVVQSRAELMNLLRKTCGEFGITSFLAGGVPGAGEDCDSHLLLNGWDSGWYDRYVAQRYFELDPVVQLMSISTSPFQWSSAAKALPISKTAAMIADEAAQFGMLDGITVPIYSRTGHQTGFTFGAERLEIDEERIGALRMIAIYGHERARELAITDGGSGSRVVERMLRLSPRELDCLRWTMLGKTSWEIGEILSLSGKTVDHYLANACKKLNAVNRPHAVGIAVRGGLI